MKHLKQFNESYDDVKTIKIETSLGIIEIPSEAIGGPIPDELTNDEWYITLKKLYTFYGLSTKSGWLYVELEDPYYGSPEYKIIN